MAGTTVLAVLIAGTPALPGPPPADAPSSGPAGPSADLPHRAVTLITGDRVTVFGDSGMVIQPGPGRSSMVYEQYRYGGHEYVIPADALPLIRDGRLDRRLFDVSELLASGYGDADRADLPLIIAHEPGVGTIITAATTVYPTRHLPQVGLTAFRAPKRDAGQLWDTLRGDGTGALASGVAAVWLDGQRRLVLDQSVHQISAPAAWQDGWTGAGVTVAVLDSGIDATHPDFGGRVLEVRNFTDAPDGNDTVGHGTHVASILAGSGAASNGTYRGVAPDADLLVGKVCPTQSCPESAILAGMAWAAEQGADVVNLSLSGTDGTDIDPLEGAVNQLTAQFGTLFVASAGNLGPDQPVGSPASADAALAVGSLDRFNNVSFFSSRGPRVGDAAVKPDIAAPGEGIVAARAADGSIGDPVLDPHYTRLTGTSMAAPHVAGAAALLAQQHPDWTAPQLKAALMASAVPSFGYSVFDQGAGRVDLARAIHQSVVTLPASISFGRSSFPHDDSDPVERVVTYHNLGSTAIELDLTLDVQGPTGFPAPPGMFTVQPDHLTLPAGSQAAVTVTADVSVDSPLGLFTGALVATGGGPTTRTPLGLDKEPERYDLVLTHLNRDGVPTGEYTTHVLGLDSVHDEAIFGGDETLTLRLPPGRYHLYSVIRTRAGDQVDVSALAQPLVDLTGDTAVTLDARVAEPMRVGLPERHGSARSAAAVVHYDRRAPDGRPLVAALAGPHMENMYTAHLGPGAPDGEVLSAVHSQWGEPGAAGEFMDTSYAYHLAWFLRGRYWTGFDERVHPADLVAVPTEQRTPMPGRIGRQVSLGFAPEGSVGAGFFFPSRPPFERIDYYLARDVVWLHEYQTLDPATDLVETIHTTPLTGYEPGRQEGGAEKPRRVWNRGVFGPAFPPADNASQWMYRHPGSLPTVAGGTIAQDTDAIAVSVPLFNDFSADHVGFSREDTGRIALYRNDQLIGETTNSRSGEFPVPDEMSSYRLEVDGSRPSYAELSTRVSGVWTFRSAHDPGVEATVLPVMALRFGPQLDAHNRAPSGQAFPLPVSVQRQAGAVDADVTGLRLEVSYDDGDTWQEVPVRPAGEQWRALLQHPSGDGFVSVRARATDSDDNSVEVTIIRAYRFGGGAH